MKLNRVVMIMFIFMLSVFSVSAVSTVNNTAYYSLDSPTSQYRDITNNGHNGSVSSTLNTSGIIGSALNSSGGFLDSNLNISNWDQMSFSMWIKPRVIPASTNNFMGIGDGGDRDLEISLMSDGTVRANVRTASGQTLPRTTTAVIAQQWTHIAMTWNRDSNHSIYINGVREDTDASIDETNDYVRNLYFLRANGGSSFDGGMDEISIWNRSLLQSEVVGLYNLGLGLQYPYSLPSPTSSINTTIQPFYNTTNISVQINSTMVINLSYSLDGAAEVSVWTNQNNGSVNITGISNGLHNITWVGATANLSELFIVDLVIPELNVTSPTTINRYRMNFSEVITFNDTNFDVCRVKVGGIFISCTNESYIFPSNGNHSFNVSVNDSAGNINIALNNLVFVNPFQNFTFTNSTGTILSNFTFNSVLYLGNQTRILTFGGGLTFGNNSFLFEKPGFQSTLVNFVINTTSHLNLTTSISEAQINLRFFDRETLVLITGTTTVTLVGPVGTDGTTTTGLFNISNINFVTGNYQVIGSNPSYFVESVFFTFTGQEVLQKDLFLISNTSTDAGTVTIQVTASTGPFVQGAICSALEWRPSSSAFVSVAEGNTNTEGITILNVEIGTKLYKFQCSKDGVSVTSPQQILQTTESVIPLVLQIGAPAPVLLLDNLIVNLYNITLNATHQQVIYNFTSTDGLVTQACLTQYKQNGNFRNNLNESCISSSTGQIQMVVDINQSYTQVMVATATQAGVNQEVDTITFVGSLSLQSSLSTYGFDMFLPLLVVIIGITIGFMLVPSNMAITSIVTLIGMWFLRYIIPGIMSTGSTIFMSVILLLIMWGSKR